MEKKETLEQSGTSLFACISSFFKKIQPIHVVWTFLPLIIIYPKPLMYILKPIMRNWSFHYRKMSEVSNKPTQIILTSNPSLSFSKRFIKSFIVVKGTLPEAFQLVGSTILDQEELRQKEDQSMKHAFFTKKHQIQKQRIFRSCYIIDMQDQSIQKSQQYGVHSRISFENRKNSEKETPKLDNQESDQFEYKETDYIRVEMILMKLKILQLQNSSEVIKHVIIRANERVLHLLETQILGIDKKQAFKLGMVGQNKIHLLRFNKNLDTYEQCSTTFKIQSNLNQN